MSRELVEGFKIQVYLVHFHDELLHVSARIIKHQKFPVFHCQILVSLLQPHNTRF